MKKNSLVAALTIFLFIVSCNKSGIDVVPGTDPVITDTTDNSPHGLATIPETKALYNNTSFGVYKGVVIGSSGTIVFRINNGDNIVKGFLSIDDTHDTLTTTQTLIAGQAITNVNFTGKISSMTLSAQPDGSNANLTKIHINGHNNVTGFIIHENSTKQVLCYEGVFSGDASGIINATRVGLNDNDTTYILTKVSNDTLLYRGFGLTTQDTARVNCYLPGGYVQFQIEGIYSTGIDNPNTFYGTWGGDYYGNGQFTAHRTY